MCKFIAGEVPDDFPAKQLHIYVGSAPLLSSRRPRSAMRPERGLDGAGVDKDTATSRPVTCKFVAGEVPYKLLAEQLQIFMGSASPLSSRRPQSAMQPERGLDGAGVDKDTAASRPVTCKFIAGEVPYKLPENQLQNVCGFCTTFVVEAASVYEAAQKGPRSCRS